MKIINDSKANVHKIHQSEIERLKLEKSELVCFISLGLISIFKILIHKILGKKICVYMHEPYSFIDRVSGLNGIDFIKSASEHAYFIAINFLTNYYIVDNENSYFRLIEFQLKRLHTRPIKICPLLFPLKTQITKDLCRGQKNIALIGRVDLSRSLSSLELMTGDHPKLVLTSSKIPSPIPAYVLNHSTKFTEEQKNELMSKCDIIFGYFSRRYNQSGANKEALCCGRPIITSVADPLAIFIDLTRLGLIISSPKDCTNDLFDFHLDEKKIKTSILNLRNIDEKLWRDL